nr:hypothetical protein [Candidatus Freyarchaeota archaeon]
MLSGDDDAPYFSPLNLLTLFGRQIIDFYLFKHCGVNYEPEVVEN